MDPANPCSDPKAALKTVVMAGVDALFGGPCAQAAAPTVPGVTLRYGTLSKFVPETDFNERTIGDLFADHAQDLGGLSVGENTTLRDTTPGAGVVGEDDAPVAGHSYVASVRKEDKGL